MNMQGEACAAGADLPTLCTSGMYFHFPDHTGGHGQLYGTTSIGRALGNF